MNIRTKKILSILLLLISIVVATSFVKVPHNQFVVDDFCDNDDSIYAAPRSMNARKVINNYLEALGGKKKINRIRKLVIIEKDTLEGMELKIIRYKMKPNKYVKEMRSGHLVLERQIFDGRQAYIVNLKGSETIRKGKHLNYIKTNAILSPASLSSRKRYKLKGVQVINNEEMYVMESKYPVLSTDYFNVNTGLLERSVRKKPLSDSTSITITKNFFDYKPTKGVQFPTYYETFFDTVKISMRIDTILVNRKAKFSMSIFEMPIK